jgi:hypothetical protein
MSAQLAHCLTSALSSSRAKLAYVSISSITCAVVVSATYPSVAGQGATRHLGHGDCGADSSAPAQHHQRVDPDAKLCSACKERVSRRL